VRNFEYRSPERCDESDREHEAETHFNSVFPLHVGAVTRRGGYFDVRINGENVSFLAEWLPISLDQAVEEEIRSFFSVKDHLKKSPHDTPANPGEHHVQWNFKKSNTLESGV
jgi:hypothetical protein